MGQEKPSESYKRIRNPPVTAILIPHFFHESYKRIRNKLWKMAEIPYFSFLNPTKGLEIIVFLATSKNTIVFLNPTKGLEIKPNLPNCEGDIFFGILQKGLEISELGASPLPAKAGRILQKD